MDVQVHLGQQSLEYGILTFKLHQLLGIGHIHPAEYGPSSVEHGIN
jgi:hypothetical protein